jgi:16S rRNA (uracil1498-N3)-methyltransferase
MTITETGKDFLKADCRPSDEGPEKHKSTDTILIQCLPKGKKLDMIVRQAVEAGVRLILPVESEYSVSVIREERNKSKLSRLNAIAEEAAKQSGNRGVTEILPPVKMEKLPETLTELGVEGIKLFFHQEQLEKGTIHRYLNDDANTVCILIGPEGGLSPSETDFLLATGFHPVYLGDNVLRTETAAIYALGAVNTILLEKNEWKIGIPELKG